VLKLADFKKKGPIRMIDVAIVGAGPAGLAAGIYAARAGLSTTLFEALMVGGQLTSIDHLENYPGFAQGVNGFEIAFSMREQVERFGAKIISEQVTKIQPSADEQNNPFFVLETLSATYEAKTVILAMGAKPRQLPIEGIESLVGRGVSYCATCDGSFFKDKTTVIVGGGDTACADAVYLSRIAKDVHLVHRRDELRASAWYARQLDSLDNVTIHWDSIVVSFEEREGKLASVTLENVKDKSKETLPTDALFIAVGTKPDTEWLSDVVELDPSGYVVTSAEGKTTTPGIFAAGDTRTTPLRQVVTAVSDGALAAEAAAKYIASW